MSNDNPLEPTNGELDVEALVSRLARISDLNQRSNAIAIRIKDLENEIILETIKSVQEKTLLGNPEYRRVYSGLIVAGTLNRTLGKERMSELVALAQDKQYYEVVAILMDLPSDTDDEVMHQPYLDADLKEMSLGMRKYLARQPDLELVERIARDQDHRVLHNLLYNPRLTEKDVVRIAATRPNSPKILEEIYNHPKWIERYAIKKSIVMNPVCPVSLALKLLAFMKAQDLKEIAKNQKLSLVLRNEVGRIMVKKMGLVKDNQTG